MTVGEKIYTLRTQAGYSQEEFAEIIGVSRQSVSKWETSSAFPDTEYVVKICKLLNISTDTLLLDDSLPDALKNGERQSDSAADGLNNQPNADVMPHEGRRLLSILGFVLSFFSAIAGLIVSCIAFRKERSNDTVNHFAVSGIAISCVRIFAAVTYICVYGVMTIVYLGGAL